MQINHQTGINPWVADQGDGTYINPILYADYSDPDVIRVAGDFYMTASSFGQIPGLPILHSRDLVNWRLINHGIQEMNLPGYDQVQHGNGVWAPSLRYHQGKYWIFYGDPDVGIMMTTATDPAGDWSPLHLVHHGKGLIDTCPFWDEDGQAYLVHAFANSRCGIKHKLRLCRMSPDGTQLLDEGVIIYDGTENHPTMEGPKLYKRNGYYYIFAPAGGVRTGWQTILRSRSIYGPYEDKIVLQQGQTPVNGPHQGGWVELASGESWFIHFQDKDAYGRIVHLQPVQWVEDWPLMGERPRGSDIGQPVLRHAKPNVGVSAAIEVPATSDEFTDQRLGLQWQWQANPRTSWYSLADRPDCLRLFTQPLPEDARTIYHAACLLMQKFPGPAFTAETVLDGRQLARGSAAGLIVFGYQYAWIGLRRKQTGEFVLMFAQGDGEQEQELWTEAVSAGHAYVRVSVAAEASCSFAYSYDGNSWKQVPCDPFTASRGHWVGAKTGIFSIAQTENSAEGYADAGGYADIDYFRVER